MVRVDADYVIAGATLCEAPSLISVLMLKQEMLGCHWSREICSIVCRPNIY